MTLLVSLDGLPTGDIATVVQLEGSPECTKRLQEMGLRPGKTVQILRAGSPCIVRIGGIRLCLRPDCRMRVLVRHASPAQIPRAPLTANSAERRLDSAPRTVHQPTPA